MPSSTAPGLGRRLACVLYESLLLAAVCLIAAFPFVPLTRALDPMLAKPLLQAYLVLVAGSYFTLFWRRGQTLAMKTWRIRMETRLGGPVGRRQAWLRYLLAGLNLLAFGLGWWSALLARDGQFLQDRLAGTRLVSA
jgi:uncharacterized RDD family membrane protein YckC